MTTCWPRIGIILLSCLLAAGLTANDRLDHVLPVRGLCIAAPRPTQIDAFLKFIAGELAPRSVNTLVLRVDYGFQYTSHPELADPQGLSPNDVAQLLAACRRHGIELIPQINLLGHQSWGKYTHRLLTAHPEFDETPWVKMPDRHTWPNEDGLYCKSYCPRHPQVHDVVFAVVDELCDAFDAKAMHAGLDEVFYIGMDKCPRCGGQDKSQLFADEVTLIRNHLHEKGRRMWMWGDRLLDGKVTGLGEWEASRNDTHRAIDLIPKDVVICDWHYERPDPTAVYFAMKGFDVVTCPWKNADSARQQLADMVHWRSISSPAMRPRFQGVMQTVWSEADGFRRELQETPASDDTSARPSQGHCFRSMFLEIGKLEPE